MKVLVLLFLVISLVFGWKVKKGDDVYLLLDNDGNLTVENGVLFVNEIRCNGGNKIKLSNGVLTCSNLPTISIDNGQDGTDEDSTDNKTTEIWVHLDKAAKSDVTFKYKTVDGTAKADDDYKAVSDKEATISAGDTDYKIEIEIVSDDDGFYEGSKEKFSVEIYDVSDNVNVGDDSGDIWIEEKDTKPVVSLKEDVSAGEDTQPDFTVQINKKADVDVSVDIEIKNGGGDNDDTDNDDFEDKFLSPTQKGSVTISAGDTSATANVKVNDDGDKENDEDYTVEISNPVNATLDNDNKTKKGTIEDNDSGGWGM